MQIEEDDNRTRYQSAEGNYTWEQSYDKSWEPTLLGEESLTDAVENAARRAKRLRKEQRRQTTTNDSRTIRRGMHRHVFLVVDMSKAMNDPDLRPTRLAVTLNHAEAFIREYFDQNPLSQLGVIITRNSRAEKLTELSGNPSRHISALRNGISTEGEPSLQNSLELARSTLTHVPKYGSREIIVVFASLTTCDPGDIYSTITNLKKDGIRTSVVGLSAELHVCRAMSDQTGGTFTVALNDDHFKELFFAHVQPPPTTSKVESSLVQMGFPTQLGSTVYSLCVCHKQLTYGGYLCPRCNGKCCELPTECQICSLILVSSPHLARSYHHLFPVPNFVEVQGVDFDDARCFSCLSGGNSLGGLLFRCSKCDKTFCYECDGYIHESLHICPGCE